MVMGKSDPQKEMQAQRVKNFMNYQIMDQMKEYESDFDQMLFYLYLYQVLHLKKFIMTIYWDEQFLSLFQRMTLLFRIRLPH